MSAPNVEEQVKAEAAKSLLERMAEKTKLVRFFRYNASAKHGVPIDSENIDIQPDRTPKEVAPEPQPAQNIVQIVKTEDDDAARIAELERRLQAEIERQRQPETPQNEPVEQQGMNDKVKGILQTLAVLGCLGLAAWGGTQLGKSDQTPKDEQRVNSPYYSPYQFLEDTGNHLP